MNKSGEEKARRKLSAAAKSSAKEAVTEESDEAKAS